MRLAVWVCEDMMTSQHHKQLTILIADENPANVDLLTSILNQDDELQLTQDRLELSRNKYRLFNADIKRRV